MSAFQFLDEACQLNIFSHQEHHQVKHQIRGFVDEFIILLIFGSNNGFNRFFAYFLSELVQPLGKHHTSIGPLRHLRFALL